MKTRAPHLLLGIIAGIVGSPAARAADAVLLQCEEDRAGETPTISARFELKDPSAGAPGFAEARQRALRYCATQTCTSGGESVSRTPAIYALGILHRRYIAGFRCVPDSTNGESRPTTAIEYRLGDPSEIDAVRAKASEQCAATKGRAELSDLKRTGDALIATFACAS